jgi:nucleoside-diphosphate kinase
MEDTFVMIKPDAVQRGHVADIMKYFEKKGLKIVGMKFGVASGTDLREHYREHFGKDFFLDLMNFMRSGPMCFTVWRGVNAISLCRRILGETSPMNSVPGTIRGDFACNIRKNLCHASDTKDSAVKEISLWFPEGVVEYKRDVDEWVN